MSSGTLENCLQKIQKAPQKKEKKVAEISSRKSSRKVVEKSSKQRQNFTLSEKKRIKPRIKRKWQRTNVKWQQSTYFRSAICLYVCVRCVCCQVVSVAFDRYALRKFIFHKPTQRYRWQVGLYDSHVLIYGEASRV